MYTKQYRPIYEAALQQAVKDLAEAKNPQVLVNRNGDGVELNGKVIEPMLETSKKTAIGGRVH
jgi:hypothetical protein